MDYRTSEPEEMVERARHLIIRFTDIYRLRALAEPHRRVTLPERRCRDPKIIRTLLGFELQIRGKRLNCPDLITARYLQVFAQIGIPEVGIPLDPTKTAELFPKLEETWEEFRKICRTMEEVGYRGKAGTLHRMLKRKVNHQAPPSPLHSSTIRDN